MNIKKLFCSNNRVDGFKNEEIYRNRQRKQHKQKKDKQRSYLKLGKNEIVRYEPTAAKIDARHRDKQHLIPQQTIKMQKRS